MAPHQAAGDLEILLRRLLTRAQHTAAGYSRQRRIAADTDQRHSRPVQARSGQAGTAPRSDRYAGFLRIPPHRFRAAGIDEIAPASIRDLTGSASCVVA